jgi:hypothetical protein
VLRYPDTPSTGTELVHEAYLRLMGKEGVEWQSRAHFFAVAASAMRSMLLDRGRAQRASKREWSPR